MSVLKPILTRRAVLAGASLMPLLAAKRKSRMKFGFTTYLWGREWDIPTLIANCTTLKAYGVEMRVEMKSAHKVELDLDAAQRREVKKMFAGSPVKVVGIATGERFDSPDPAKLQASVEKAKRYAELSHDIGGRGIRVFPNDFQKGMPQEATIAQVAKSLRAVAQAAAGVGQLVRLENHGSAGRLTTLKLILDQVPEKNVVVKLNSDVKDAADGAFEKNFTLVKARLGDTLHAHDVLTGAFPYQQQVDLLVDAGWEGWWLPEMDGKPKDAMAELAAQRAKFEEMVAASLKRA